MDFFWNFLLQELHDGILKTELLNWKSPHFHDRIWKKIKQTKKQQNCKDPVNWHFYNIKEHFIATVTKWLRFWEVGQAIKFSASTHIYNEITECIYFSFIRKSVKRNQFLRCIFVFLSMYYSCWVWHLYAVLPDLLKDFLPRKQPFIRWRKF